MRPPTRLKTPCPSDRPTFEVRGGLRFCLHCEQATHDLRDATERQVRALVSANGGKLCARVRVWPSGELRFSPEPPPRGLSGSSQPH